MKERPDKTGKPRPPKARHQGERQSGRRADNKRRPVPAEIEPAATASRKAATSTSRQPAENPLLIWGVHPVHELLRQQPQAVAEIFLLAGREDERRQAILALAEEHGIPLSRPSQLPQLPVEDAAHQGVAARIRPPVPLSLNELLARLEPKASPLLLALDSIQDPHNLGAIIRSAAAFGVNGLILPKDRSARISGTVLKAAAGTLPLVPICQVTNLAAALAALKEHGFWIYGAAGEAAGSLYENEFSGPLCLVLGGEQKGLRPLVRRHCDFLISIPLATGVESLNVSVAAAVILAEIRRPRTA